MRSEITFRECDLDGVEEPQALLLEILSELGQAQEDLYRMLRLLEHGNPEGPGREVSVLNLRGRRRRLGEEVFVQEGHGCPSFQARKEALEGTFLEAFGEVEPGLDAEGPFLRDGRLALPALVGPAAEWIEIAEKRRAAVIAGWHGLSSLSKQDDRLPGLLKALKLRVAELLSKRDRAEYWVGQEWGEELYRLVWSVLVEKSEPPERQGD